MELWKTMDWCNFLLVKEFDMMYPQTCKIGSDLVRYSRTDSWICFRAIILVIVSGVLK